MRLRIFGLAVISSITLLAGGAGQASATTASCTSANGGTTLAGATNIGTIGTGCEIGPFSASEGSNTGPGYVSYPYSSANNPSIYEFTWNGGVLEIQEEVGNNGADTNINVELGLLSAVTLSATGSLNGALVSTYTPYQSGPSAPVVVYDATLAAGTYVLDTYLGTCEVAGSNCTSGENPTDPDYQVLFTPVSATPLPGALPLFAGGLGVAGAFGWRRKRKNTAAIVAA
jgi:hypothetical protein